MIVACLISCKQATNYQPRSVKVIEGDMQNTYFFEYDSLSRLKSWQSDYNDRVHSTVITKFVYSESAIDIFKSEGNHREGGARYNMSPYKLVRNIKMDGWKPSEIIDPQNQQTLFKFFYKDDLISCSVYYHSGFYRGIKDSMIYELDKNGNMIREFLYHTNYLKRYEVHPDTLVYEFDDNPNPWYKFIGNVNNGRFLPATEKFNNYSFEFDPTTFFSPNNIRKSGVIDHLRPAHLTT
jgi:hypothetical protein